MLLRMSLDNVQWPSFGAHLKVKLSEYGTSFVFSSSKSYPKNASPEVTVVLGLLLNKQSPVLFCALFFFFATSSVHCKQQ